MNSLLDLYTASKDDEEVRTLTFAILGDSPQIRQFFGELMELRALANLSSPLFLQTLPSSSTTSTSTSGKKMKNPDTKLKNTSSVATKADVGAEVTTGVAAPHPSLLPTSMEARHGAVDSATAPGYDMHGTSDVHFAQLLTNLPEHARYSAAQLHQRAEEEAQLRHNALFAFSVSSSNAGSSENGKDDNRTLLSPALLTHASLRPDPSKSKKKNREGKTTIESKIRTPCNCQCMEHPFFSNCRVCGRVVCEAEGAGSCFFCFSHVTALATIPNEDFIVSLRAQNHEINVTRGIEDMFDFGSSAASSDSVRATTNSMESLLTTFALESSTSIEDLKRRAQTQKQNQTTHSSSSSSYGDAPVVDEDSLAKAVLHRDNLLSRANAALAAKGRGPGAGNGVIDEQADFYDFEGNVWMAEEDRKRAEMKAIVAEELLEQKRNERKLELDLSNSTVGISSTKHLNFAGFGGVGSLQRDFDQLVEEGLQKELGEDKKTSTDGTEWSGKIVTAKVVNRVGKLVEGTGAGTGKSAKYYIPSDEDGQASIAVGGVGGPASQEQLKTLNYTQKTGSNAYVNSELTGKALQVYNSLKQIVAEKSKAKNSYVETSDASSASSTRTVHHPSHLSHASRSTNNTNDDNEDEFIMLADASTPLKKGSGLSRSSSETISYGNNKNIANSLSSRAAEKQARRSGQNRLGQIYLANDALPASSATKGVVSRVQRVEDVSDLETGIDANIKVRLCAYVYI